MVAEIDLPTQEAFEQDLGEPLLAFGLEQHDVPIPIGPPYCCRVVHETYCDAHVAKTLIDCEFDILLPDGEVDRRRPIKRTFDGDVLARPREFAAAVGSVAALAEATAEAEGGRLIRLVHHVWTLNLDQAAIWGAIQERQDAEYQDLLEQFEPHSGAWIEALPVELLDSDCPQDLAAVMGRPDFRPVQAYARKVLVLPTEIGHDSAARYVTSPLAPTALPPAVEAILRDPQEEGD